MTIAIANIDTQNFIKDNMNFDVPITYTQDN